MRPPPTTAEYIEGVAARVPQRLAVWEEGHETSYGQLRDMVLRCGLELQALGVRRGQRVAVSGPGFGIQLVLLIAAEALGAVTVSFQADGDPEAGWLLPRVDWVFSCLPQQLAADVRFQLIDTGFVRRLAQPVQQAPEWSALPADAPQRWTRTSGSSGSAKFMMLSRQAQEWWIQVALETPGWSMDEGTRYLVLSPLVVNSTYARASGCLRRGGAVLVGDATAFAEMAPTHLTGLPMQLETLLAQLPAQWRPSTPVAACSFGGPLAPALQQRLQSRFGMLPRNAYGSNETAMVCDMLDDSGAGVLRAGVDVRILDAQGRALPLGSEGIVALRSPAVVEGYLERPEESAAAFRDGWFVSGDVGVLLARRVLRLLGRHDDLVVLGGLKVPAALLEARLRQLAGLADCALLTGRFDAGRASLGLVAVSDDPAAAAHRLEQAVREVFAEAPQVGVRVEFAAAIPRLPGGKVDRMALLRLLQQE